MARGTFIKEGEQKIIIEWYKSGATVKQIVKITGRSTYSVQRILAPFRNKLPKSKNVELVKCAAEGMSLTEIADKYNQKPAMIGTRLNQIRRDFGAKNIPHLVSIAYKNKYLSIENL